MKERAASRNLKKNSRPRRSAPDFFERLLAAMIFFLSIAPFTPTWDSMTAARQNLAGSVTAQLTLMWEPRHPKIHGSIKSTEIPLRHVRPKPMGSGQNLKRICGSLVFRMSLVISFLPDFFCHRSLKFNPSIHLQEKKCAKKH